MIMGTIPTRIYMYVLFVIVWSLFQAVGNTAQGDKPRRLEGSKLEVFLERLKDVQARVETFQAEFVEKRKLAMLNKPILYKGRLYYDSEGLFFMEYDKPVKHIIRVQGKKALLWVRGSPTADVVNLSGVQGVVNPRDLFNYSRNKSNVEVWEQDSRYRLEERSPQDEGKAGGKNVKVFLHHETLMVKRIRLQEKGGDFTELLFSNIRINQDLPSGVSGFTLPEGVKVNRVSPE